MPDPKPAPAKADADKKQGPEIREIDIAGTRVLLAPSGHQIFDLEPHLPQPRRRRARVDVLEAASFIAYVNRFKSAASLLWGKQSENGLAACAILDYHPADPVFPHDPASAWGDHRVTLRTDFSPEWMKWRKNDQKPMGQVDFAHFIENAARDFVQPEQSEMLTLVLTLEAKQNVEWKSAARLSSGDVSLQYVSETKVGGSGEEEIPTSFKIGIPVFRGGPRYEFEARLRYKLTEGTLSLWFELLQVEQIIDRCVSETLELIGKETGISPLAGLAPEKI